MPICCEPNVMRLWTAGLLYLSTYARKNCPPDLCHSVFAESKRKQGFEPCEKPTASKPLCNSGIDTSCCVTISNCSLILPYQVKTIVQLRRTASWSTQTYETSFPIFTLVLVNIDRMNEYPRMDFSNELHEFEHSWRGM